MPIRQRFDTLLLDESDLEGLAFNTPIPFYDVGVSCGNPMEIENVYPFYMMMPDEVLGINDTFCTRATGESMIGVGIMPGDLLVMEKVAEYYSHDIVLAYIDGEGLLKTYYVDENGDQWLVAANPKYPAIKLDGSRRVYFKGRLKHHFRQPPRQSMQSIVESINEAKAKMKQHVVISEAFRSLVTKPECAEKVVTRLHELSDGKQKPRDMMMPMRAAMEAGALRRPTWAEYMSEFGCNRTSKTSLSDYTDPTKNKFEDDPQFWVMVDEFLRLIAR